MRVNGRDALRLAERYALPLNKRQDSVEEAREGLSLDEAYEVAEEDPALLYVDAPDLHGGTVLMSYSPDGIDGNRVIVGQTEISQSQFCGTTIVDGRLHNVFRYGNSTYFFQAVY